MRLPTFVILVPVAIVAAMLAIANREEIAFTFVPFVQHKSDVTLVMPLFWLVFASFLLGVLLGSSPWRSGAGAAEGANYRPKTWHAC